MSATLKSIRPEAEIMAAIGNPAACAALGHKGLERAVEAGNFSFDLAVQHNTEVLAIIKKALKGTTVPGMFILDLAVQAFEGYVSAQKQLLELFLEQSSSVVEAVENYKQNAGNANDELAKAFQATLDRSVAAQNTVVEFAAKQSKAVSETIKQQPGIAGTPMESFADSIQNSFDTALGMQKEFLSNAVKPLKMRA